MGVMQEGPVWPTNYSYFMAAILSKGRWVKVKVASSKDNHNLFSRARDSRKFENDSKVFVKQMCLDALSSKRVPVYYIPDILARMQTMP